MSKNNKFKNFINKKGFTVAVYSCAGVLIALMGIMSAKNMSSEKSNPNNEQAQLEQANQSDVKSYKVTENDSNTKKEENNKTSESETNSKKDDKANTASETKKDDKTDLKNNDKNPNKTTTNEKNTTEQSSNKSAAQDKVFSLFDDTKEMSWPVNGQIIMDYSIETAVYDKTLDQYRTNDTLCIAAEEGSEVKAAAEGVVKSVYNDREHGTTVVIDHGNGWLSTYSQLSDNLTVKEGDITPEGFVIGAIAQPTYYSSSIGPHLEFKITKNDSPTDPKLVLAQYDE